MIKLIPHSQYYKFDCYLSQNSTQRQNSLQQQQLSQQPQQQFQQQQQGLQNNETKSNSNELQGIVLQETDRYAGLSIAFNADSIAPTANISAQQPNPLTNPQGLLGNEFDTNFNSINTNNFTINAGICTSANQWKRSFQILKCYYLVFAVIVF